VDVLPGRLYCGPFYRGLFFCGCYFLNSWVLRLCLKAASDLHSRTEGGEVFQILGRTEAAVSDDTRLHTCHRQSSDHIDQSHTFLCVLKVSCAFAHVLISRAQCIANAVGIVSSLCRSERVPQLHLISRILPFQAPHTNPNPNPGRSEF